jgi:phage-related tail fiber protein
MKRIIAGLLFALLATSAQAQLVLPGAGGGGVFPFTEPAIKSPAQVATTGANITLSGEQTIDGVLTSASRVLVKDQNTASQNGLYTTGSGAWIRALDFNANGQVVQGTQVYVTQGAVNKLRT